MNKIFCVMIGIDQRNDFNVIAIAEDGKLLATHTSSSEEFAKHDIGLTSDWKHESYKKHYPDGYELEWIGYNEKNNHEGLKKAHEQNKKPSHGGLNQT